MIATAITETSVLDDFMATAKQLIATIFIVLLGVWAQAQAVRPTTGKEAKKGRTDSFCLRTAASNSGTMR